nr:MAG TPA: hypothetical protein [Caudoviricetes sp.]
MPNKIRLLGAKLCPAVCQPFLLFKLCLRSD